MSNYTPEEHKAIATEILRQLGGNRFKMMTGAKNLIIMDNLPGGGLRLDFPMFSKANRLEITVDCMDTYTVKFYKHTGIRITGSKITDPKNTLYKECTGVYNDMLQDIFTSTTGLNCTLGTMRGAQ